jgi:hypothetical protein
VRLQSNTVVSSVQTRYFFRIDAIRLVSDITRQFTRPEARGTFSIVDSMARRSQNFFQIETMTGIGTHVGLPRIALRAGTAIAMADGWAVIAIENNRIKLTPRQPQPKRRQLVSPVGHQVNLRAAWGPVVDNCAARVRELRWVVD